MPCRRDCRTACGWRLQTGGPHRLDGLLGADTGPSRLGLLHLVHRGEIVNGRSDTPGLDPRSGVRQGRNRVCCLPADLLGGRRGVPPTGRDGSYFRIGFKFAAAQPPGWRSPVSRLWHVVHSGRRWLHASGSATPCATNCLRGSGKWSATVAGPRTGDTTGSGTGTHAGSAANACHSPARRSYRAAARPRVGETHSVRHGRSVRGTRVPSTGAGP